MLKMYSRPVLTCRELLELSWLGGGCSSGGAGELRRLQVLKDATKVSKCSHMNFSYFGLVI